MTLKDIGYAAISGSILVPAAARAEGVRLPIFEGLWVETDTQCGAVYMVRVGAAGRFRDIYLYGPAQSLGPANQTEVVARTRLGRNSFTGTNEAPWRWRPFPGGQAIVRSFIERRRAKERADAAMFSRCPSGKDASGPGPNEAAASRSKTTITAQLSVSQRSKGAHAIEGLGRARAPAPPATRTDAFQGTTRYPARSPPPEVPGKQKRAVPGTAR